MSRIKLKGRFGLRKFNNILEIAEDLAACIAGEKVEQLLTDRRFRLYLNHISQSAFNINADEVSIKSFIASTFDIFIAVLNFCTKRVPDPEISIGDRADIVSNLMSLLQKYKAYMSSVQRTAYANAAYNAANVSDFARADQSNVEQETFINISAIRTLSNMLMMSN